eukprot:UN27925
MLLVVVSLFSRIAYPAVRFIPPVSPLESPAENCNCSADLGSRLARQRRAAVERLVDVEDAAILVYGFSSPPLVNASNHHGRQRFVDGTGATQPSPLIAASIATLAATLHGTGIHAHGMFCPSMEAVIGGDPGRVPLKSILPCPTTLIEPAPCFLLRMEEVKLAMLEAAASAGLPQRLFIVDTDMLFLYTPKRSFCRQPHS